MAIRLTISAVLAVAALALGAPGAGAGEATKLKLRNSPYGKVLFANGYALYVFTADEGSASDCYDACAVAWPPLLADGELVAGDGVKEGKLGTTERTDGSLQITYAGKPLYGYVHDPRGRVYCHDVREFGGPWYAIRRSGRAAPH
jgi:predicted lipoprotein with Yx(FWY)xxD motif